MYEQCLLSTNIKHFDKLEPLQVAHCHSVAFKMKNFKRLILEAQDVRQRAQ